MIHKEAIKKLSDDGLKDFIVDCMTRAVVFSGKEYSDEQIKNALNGARELKARELGVNVEELEAGDTNGII